MDNKIKHIFNIQAFLFVISIMMISISSTFFLSFKQVKSQIISDFNHDLEITTNQFNYKCKMSMEHIKAISSRTMIRKELYKLYKKEVTLDQVKSYTQSKYEDGASVYEFLVYAERTDINGNVVAIYEPFSISGFNMEEQTFYRDEDGYNIIIKNEIIHNKEIIGYDRAVFKLGRFPEGESVLLQNITIMKDPKENTSMNEYASSFRIGETDCYLYAELNQKVLKSELSKGIVNILIQSLFIIIGVISVSYFTIMKLSLKLVNKLNDSARVDPLTNLSNRKALWEKVADTQQQSIRYGFSFAIFYIDIDGFKPVNDNYGHTSGDTLLKMISKRLLSTVRSTDMVFRIGGDEFVILISQMSDSNHAGTISTKIIDSIKKPFEIGSNKIEIGASIGITISDPEKKEDIEELLSKADAAMYEVKKSGKNNYKIYSE